MGDKVSKDAVLDFMGEFLDMLVYDEKAVKSGKASLPLSKYIENVTSEFKELMTSISVMDSE